MPEAEWWTPIYSRLFDPDHELATDPVCKRWAWADLCHQAQRKKTTRLARGKPVVVDRGQLLVSVRFLADRWRWSTSKVGRFLILLGSPEIGKIETVAETPGGTVYRIVAYEDYALAWDAERDADRNTRETLAKQRIDGKEGIEKTYRAHTRARDGDLVSAVGQFLDGTGAPWRLSVSIEDWAEGIAREPKYAGADLAYEIRKAADWHAGKKKTPRAPDQAIRNWLEKAASDARERSRPARSPTPGMPLQVLR